MGNTLTVKQAAYRLSVKPITVRSYIKKGKLSGKKMGNEWMIAEDELNMKLNPTTIIQNSKRLKLIGLCKDLPISTNDFIKLKQEEIKNEDRNLS